MRCVPFGVEDSWGGGGSGNILLDEVCDPPPWGNYSTCCMVTEGGRVREYDEAIAKLL